MDEAPSKKPDGSAFQAHMDALKERNDATRKVGRQQREESERSKAQEIHATEQRQTAELRRRSNKRGGSASLVRGPAEPKGG